METREVLTPQCFQKGMRDAQRLTLKAGEGIFHVRVDGH